MAFCKVLKMEWISVEARMKECKCELKKNDLEEFHKKKVLQFYENFMDGFPFCLTELCVDVGLYLFLYDFIYYISSH